MAYAIKYEYLRGSQVRAEWIDSFGLLVHHIENADRFGKRESAEIRAFTLATKNPDFLGRLKVVVIVVGHRKGDTRWRELRKRFSRSR